MLTENRVLHLGRSGRPRSRLQHRTNYGDHVTIDNTTGDIFVRRAFDHELKETLRYLVMCHVYDRLSDGRQIYSAASVVTLKVKDVDDNDPYIDVRGQGGTQLRQQTLDVMGFTEVHTLLLVH